MTKFIALHNHWITATGAKRFMLASAPIDEPFSRLPDEYRKLAQTNAQLLRLCAFYALMRVVIEGYADSGLHDECLDKLLVNTDYIESLQRCRNAVFHYQKDPLSPKLLGFLKAPESDIWIKNVYDAFEEFFEEKLPVPETLEYLKANHGNGVASEGV